MDGGCDQTERPRVQSAVEPHDVRTCAVVVALGADAAGEHVLRDVDLMFFTIDVSGGTHDADPLHIGCPDARCLAGPRGRSLPVESTI